MDQQDRRVAIVTGANRGLGLETSRRLAELGHHVIMGGRAPAAIEAAAADLEARGLSVEARHIDLADGATIEALARDLAQPGARVDVLVNNAGVFPTEASLAAADPETARDAFETNVVGPLRLIQVVLPVLRRRGWGRIVNVSSGMASLADMGGGYPTYRMSKAALNALTRVVAAETRGTGILVNAVSPGWVRTRMGGAGASRSVEAGAAGIVWAATLPDGGPTGGFFQDGKAVPW
jgi:NAD(P)-dependent dehydrogenase (short-subunit alcohol dehydrogenase family)